MHNEHLEKGSDEREEVSLKNRFFTCENFFKA